MKGRAILISFSKTGLILLLNSLSGDRTEYYQINILT